MWTYNSLCARVCISNYFPGNFLNEPVHVNVFSIQILSADVTIFEKVSTSEILRWTTWEIHILTRHAHQRFVVEAENFWLTRHAHHLVWFKFSFLTSLWMKHFSHTLRKNFFEFLSAEPKKEKKKENKREDLFIKI